jgi:hypothetical protein
MYETTPNYSYIRLTVGTGRIGLTYYLSCKKLKQLISRLDESEYLKDDRPTSAKTNDSPTDNYHLERSYLIWLNRLSLVAKSRLDVFSQARPPRPFVDRVHDWTFRMNPSEDDKSFTPADIFELLASSSYLIPQLSAMSVAAFIYGGLHLLAWNAPFRAPIYSLLWKISGITTASLGIFPLLALLNYSDLIFWPGVPEGRWRSACLETTMVVAYTGAWLLALLYASGRVYLVVESFLSLAYLPESVCTTPNFSLYFPHIG